MVLNNFLMILSGVLSGLDDILTVSWECLMNNRGRSLLRAEWSRTAKKLTSWLFGTLLVQIRTVGQGHEHRVPRLGRNTRCFVSKVQKVQISLFTPLRYCRILKRTVLVGSLQFLGKL